MQLFNTAIDSPWVLAAVVITVTVAAWTDWHSWRIPNVLVAASMTASMMLALFEPESIGIRSCLLGGMTGLAVFMPLYVLKGMAAGDVKLLGVVGLYVGPAMVIDIAILSCLIGGVWALVLIDLRSGFGPVSWLVLRYKTSRCARQTVSAKSQSEIIPYGVVIAAGTLSSIALAR
jgi:prepilin peptidase CpaA